MFKHALQGGWYLREDFVTVPAAKQQPWLF